MMNFFLESITFDYVYECLNHDFKAVSSDSFAVNLFEIPNFEKNV